MNVEELPQTQASTLSWRFTAKNEKIKTCKQAMRRKKTYKQHKQREKNKKRKERDGRILEIVEIAKYPKKEERPPENIKSSSSLREGKSFDEDRKKLLKVST